MRPPAREPREKPESSLTLGHRLHPTAAEVQMSGLGGCPGRHRACTGEITPGYHPLSLPAVDPDDHMPHGASEFVIAVVAHDRYGSAPGKYSEEEPSIGIA